METGRGPWEYVLYWDQRTLRHGPNKSTQDQTGQVQAEEKEARVNHKCQEQFLALLDIHFP